MLTRALRWGLATLVVCSTDLQSENSHNALNTHRALFEQRASVKLYNLYNTREVGCVIAIFILQARKLRHTLDTVMQMTPSKRQKWGYKPTQWAPGTAPLPPAVLPRPPLLLKQVCILLLSLRMSAAGSGPGPCRFQSNSLESVNDIPYFKIPIYACLWEYRTGKSGRVLNAQSIVFCFQRNTFMVEVWILTTCSTDCVLLQYSAV